MTLESLMPEQPNGTSAFETIVIGQLSRLTEGQEEQKKEIVAVGVIAEQTLTQATQTNGRVSRNEARLNAIEAWKEALTEARHEQELIEAEHRRQRQQVKRAAFGLVSALDHPWVTASLIATIAAAGWALSDLISVPW